MKSYKVVNARCARMILEAAEYTESQIQVALRDCPQPYVTWQVHDYALAQMEREMDTASRSA